MILRIVLLFWGIGALAMLGVIVCMIGIGIEARKVPNRPLHMRMNPHNILMDSSLWTPEIRTLHTWAVRSMLVAMGSVAVSAALTLWRDWQ